MQGGIMGGLMEACDSRIFVQLVAFLSRRFHPSPSRSFPAAPVFCRAEAGEIFRDYAQREINLLLWFSLIAVTTLLLTKLARLFGLWLKGSRIPGPPCPSFYGHSILFSGDHPQEDLTDLLSKSHEEYGSVVKLWLAPDELLVSMKDPMLIKEMLTKVADKSPLTGKEHRLTFGPSNLFVSSFNKALERRHLLAVELDGRLHGRASIMTETILNSINYKISSVGTEGSIDCLTISQHIAFSLLGSMVFGDAFLTWSKVDAYEDLLRKIAKDAFFWGLCSMTPFWDDGYWKLQDLCTELKNLTQDFLLQHNENYRVFCHKESLEKMAKAEFGDLSYIGVPVPGYSYVQGSGGSLNTQEDPSEIMMGMMFHGYLTTAGLTSNILASFALQPELQDKLFLEISKVCKDSKNINHQDVSNMHLLLATAYESARLLPIGPLLLRCSPHNDLKLKNRLTIPAGALLIAPMQLVQLDRLIWGHDATEFNPYRFLSKRQPGSEDSEYDFNVLSDLLEYTVFFSFGAGIRSCIGGKFAVLQTAALIASLIKIYEIELQPGTSVNPMPSSMSNCILQHQPSPQIVFLPRGA